MTKHNQWPNFETPTNIWRIVWRYQRDN